MPEDLEDELKNIKERLYLSTIAEDDFDMAEEYGLGLEIAEFCTAMNMDGELYEIFDGNVRIKMRSADRFVFHGPFADLAPCCIDPRVRQVSMERYIQAVKLAEHYGIKRIVLHSGFIPQVYFPHWYHEESVKFWKELLAQLEGKYPDLKKKLFGAIQRYPLYGWNKETMER